MAKAFEEMGFKIYATEHTAEALQAAVISSISVLRKVKESIANPSILDYLQERKIDLVINLPMGIKQGNYSDILAEGYIIRRQAVEFNVPVITNLDLASALVRVLKQRNHNGTSIRSLNEYMDELSWKLW